MERLAPRWSAPSLTRHRTAIIALTTVILGFSLYYVHDHLSPLARTLENTSSGLHRSNARRQRRRAGSGPSPQTFNPVHFETSRYVADEPWGSTPIDLGFLRNPASSDEVLSQHILRANNGRNNRVALTRHLPTAGEIWLLTRNREEAGLLRRELEEAFLTLYFFRHLSPTTVSAAQESVILHELYVDGDFYPDAIQSVLSHHQNHRLRQSIERWLMVQHSRIDDVRNEELPLQPLRSEADRTATDTATLEGYSAATDDESEHSWRGERGAEDGKEASKEGQSLLNLLWRIAEEQARKDGYVHRRVTCNACNTMPIRGIRYHCANCLDYDLCEQCEAMQIHPKTHVFYKIRIPAPFMRNSRQPQPVWYPGKPVVINQSLERESTANICKDTGFQSAEVEALWEQFRCLAATEWTEDPCNYRLAIDRQTFDKCFVPQNSLRPPPPNLIHDRMFAFYDQNGDGLIGFTEFANGLASLSRKKADQRQKRVFKGYDINEDSFVDRKDFLRMFKAYYALTKELTRDVIAGMEDDIPDSGPRDIILGSQPISSAFTGNIPNAGLSRNGEGKFRDNNGDLVIFDDMRVIDEGGNDFADLSDTLADAAEESHIRHVRLQDIRKLYLDAWPPEAATIVDVEMVLERSIAPKQIIEPQNQHKIRRAVHTRLANAYLEVSLARRRAIRRREKRRIFHVDSEDDARTAGTPGLDNVVESGLGQFNSRQWQNLRTLFYTKRDDEFKDFVSQKVEEYDWPICNSLTGLTEKITMMILYGYTESALTEDLLGYAASSVEAETFVASIITALNDLAEEPTPKDLNENEDPKDSHQPTQRSRSSSKVRFQDDIEIGEVQGSRSRATSISSRSIPLNERWGGCEVPELEKDVGREVIYQVTQEAFNELLDPIFRLREDLALEVMNTKSIRDRFRAEIVSLVKDPIEVKQALALYQLRWRTHPDDVVFAGDGSPEQDEGTGFESFLTKRGNGILDRDTADLCHDCDKGAQDSWIPLGGCCSCGQPSPLVVMAPRSTNDILGMNDFSEEKCSQCAQDGKESIIRVPIQERCVKCGQNSTFFITETTRLLRIIGGGDLPVPQNPAESEANGAVIVDNPTQIPVSSLSLKAALDINNPFTLQQDIAEKPLSTILLESGYTITTPPRSASPPPDPTLPQNRPNDHSPTPPPLSEPRTDPTLPQNRPSSPSQTHLNSTPHPLPSSSLPIPSSSKQKQQASSQLLESTTPKLSTLRYWAALSLLEHEDKQRGGPGRLNFEEFEQIMKGEKGRALGFLGTWIEMASF